MAEPMPELMDEDAEIDENEFILNHVVLPRYLPPEQMTYAKQLELAKLFVKNILDTPQTPEETIKFFKQFERVHQDVSANALIPILSEELESLQPNDTLAMIVHRQNCTLLIKKREDDVILATFRCDIDANEIYSHESDLEVTFSFDSKCKFSKFFRIFKI